MIPKKIHYCWFSGDKKSRFIRRCIKSWQKVMPDYEIVCWDANSFDFDSVPFVKQALAARKWAFVADYIRLYALYTQGGIYLDSDVKVYKRFDEFLHNRMFMGTEPLANDNVELEPAIMGSESGHSYLKECLEEYEKMKFDFSTVPTCPELMTPILEKYGYVAENRTQEVSNGVKVYSRDYFGHCWGDRKSVV